MTAGVEDTGLYLPGENEFAYFGDVAGDWERYGSAERDYVDAGLETGIVLVLAAAAVAASRTEAGTSEAESS